MTMRINAAMLLLVLILTAPLSARAAEPPVPTAPGDSIVETLEVKMDEVKAPERASLRFLKDNRVFIRSQLDRLRTQVTREYADGAMLLDARYLRLQEMSAAIAAAQDTIGGEHARAAQRSLLASVTELGQLEASLDLMDSLLVDQRSRLLWLEQDFLGHQETALVIVIRGLPGRDTPTGISISEDQETTRVPLSTEQCASLAKGGIAQIYHEFVEPRTHAIQIKLEGGAWDTTTGAVVTLEAARDRLTFLELDLSRLDREQASQGLVTRVWYR
jgi:hypothetical protein